MQTATGPWLLLDGPQCMCIDSRPLTELTFWKISTGRICTTGCLIHFMFDSRLWFSGMADQMALVFLMDQIRSLGNSEWPYLSNGSSNPLHVWFFGRVLMVWWNFWDQQIEWCYYHGWTAMVTVGHLLLTYCMKREELELTLEEYRRTQSKTFLVSTWITV